jgi:glucokinase
MSKVLLIDIGGTNLRYAYSDGDFSSLTEINKIQLSCIKGFNEILTNLIEDKDVDSLVISVAGPKINGSITMTNRDFSINEEDIKNTFNFKTCHLLNDWESIGHSLAAYEDSDIAIIKQGTEFNSNSFFIGPGTGLGAALLIGNDNVIPTEIGNTTGFKSIIKKLLY